MALRGVNATDDARSRRLLRRLLIERWGVTEGIEEIVADAVEEAGSVEGAIAEAIRDARELEDIRARNTRLKKIKNNSHKKTKKKAAELKAVKKIAKDYLRKNR
jgi:pimeloyl-CoA synthetase